MAECVDPVGSPSGRRFELSHATRIQHSLQKSLESHEISQREGGSAGRVPYIEGWRVIEKAQKIFGFDGWSSRILEMKKEYEERVQSNQRWQTAYTATVRVELRDGTFHEDVGVGTGIDRDRGKAIENARKEAVTDAVKRALRYFGPALGLSVYDKQYVKQTMKKPVPPAPVAQAPPPLMPPAPAFGQFTPPAAATPMLAQAEAQSTALVMVDLARHSPPPAPAGPSRSAPAHPAGFGVDAGQGSAAGAPRPNGAQSVPAAPPHDKRLAAAPPAGERAAKRPADGFPSEPAHPVPGHPAAAAPLPRAAASPQHHGWIRVTEKRVEPRAQAVPLAQVWPPVAHQQPTAPPNASGASEGAAGPPPNYSHTAQPPSCASAQPPPQAAQPASHAVVDYGDPEMDAAFGALSQF
mmetsp:Transcript_2121/g.6650  ORF Transcript_2121/g.6650 Transcript_2121/m.6650 type:complete len:409 (-) Transcript_2121:944-2170(-)